MWSVIPTLDEIEDLFHNLVSEKLQELFETKHLYQSVTIDLSPLEQQIEQVKGPPVGLSLVGPTTTQEEADRKAQAPFRNHLEKIVSSPWKFDTEALPLQRRP